MRTGTATWVTFPECKPYILLIVCFFDLTVAWLISKIWLSCLTISVSIGCLYDLVKILWNVNKWMNEKSNKKGFLKFSCYLLHTGFILSHVRVTVGRLWIGDWFIDHLQIITTSNCSTVTNSHTLQFTTAHTKFFPSAVSSPVVIWLQHPAVDVPHTLGSWTIPVPQLPASNSISSQWLNCSSVTHQPAFLFSALTNSQTGSHLTPTAYSSDWLQLN
jgi:hypothetical protein